MLAARLGEPVGERAGHVDGVLPEPLPQLVPTVERGRVVGPGVARDRAATKVSGRTTSWAPSAAASPSSSHALSTVASASRITGVAWIAATRTVSKLATAEHRWRPATFRRAGSWLSVSRGLIMVGLALVAVVLAAPPAAARTQTRPGVVTQGDVTERDFARMQRGGVRTLRVLVRWRAIEPEAGTSTGPASTGLRSRRVTHGVELLPFVYGSPKWVAEPESRPPLDSPAARDAWRSFLSPDRRSLSSPAANWRRRAPPRSAVGRSRTSPTSTLLVAGSEPTRVRTAAADLSSEQSGPPTRGRG